MATLSLFDAASVLRAGVMLEAEKVDGRLGLILRTERSQGQSCEPSAPVAPPEPQPQTAKKPQIAKKRQTAKKARSRTEGRA
jgi:hypothetical protein